MSVKGNSFLLLPQTKLWSHLSHLIFSHKSANPVQSYFQHMLRMWWLLTTMSSATPSPDVIVSSLDQSNSLPPSPLAAHSLYFTKQTQPSLYYLSQTLASLGSLPSSGFHFTQSQGPRLFVTNERLQDLSVALLWVPFPCSALTHWPPNFPKLLKHSKLGMHTFYSAWNIFSQMNKQCFL